MNNSYTIYGGGGGGLKTTEKNIYPHRIVGSRADRDAGISAPTTSDTYKIEGIHNSSRPGKKSVISGRPYPIFSSSCVKTCPLKARNSPRVTYHVVQKVGNHVRPVH